MRHRNELRRAVVALLAAAACWPAAAADASIAPGALVPNPALRTLDGSRQPLLSADARANVFVFFRPHQEHSIEALRQLAGCEAELAGKNVRWVGIVSSTWAAEDVLRTIAEAGVTIPVLIDEDDALYGQLGVRVHPVLGVADRAFKLIAYEPFRSVQWCERVRADIRLALGEISPADAAAVANPRRAAEPNEIEGAIARRHARMAEGYLRMQMYEKAAAEARRALELDPGLRRAQDVLDEALAAPHR